MLRKLLLFGAAAIVTVLVYKYAMSVMVQVRGVTYANGVLTCEYDGRSYASGEQREAEDACNVCTCGRQGWSCTRLSCVPAGPDAGVISGTLAAPDGGKVPAERVCAVALKDGKETCRQTVAGSTAYVLSASVGDYWVYASVADSQSTKRAYYSKNLTCSETSGCKDHTPITVTVAHDEVAHANPVDWHAGAQIDTLDVTPSKWEYQTHNYYPSSRFVLKGQGLADVELFATAYPPQANVPDAPIGWAEKTSDAPGKQAWALPVPQGLQAMAVYAVGTATNGDTVRSMALRIVRPISTDSAAAAVIKTGAGS